MTPCPPGNDLVAVYEIRDLSLIAPLFADWQETFVLSCLQGYMGKAYGDHPNCLRSARISVGGFHFFTGQPNQELIQCREAGNSEFAILVPNDDLWEREIQSACRGNALRHIRYATKKEGDVFDRERLSRLAACPSREYQLQPIDKGLYAQILSLDWAGDLCANYPTYEDYARDGLGVAATLGGVVVAGASSYLTYRGGIELEIDTRKDQRRRGLAQACGARLMLDCLNRGIYPSWDAHDQVSLALAEKLGYRLDRAYPVYLTQGPDPPKWE